MNDDTIVGGARPVPWHYWAVTVISLLWNCFGAFDYSMTKLRNADYLAQFPPEMMTYLDAMPSWLTIFWALGVWGALAGSVLLLLRSRHAVTAFALSLLGLAVSTVYQLAVPLPDALRSTGMIAMNLVIWAGALFFLWYSWRARGRGWLR